MRAPGGFDGRTPQGPQDRAPREGEARAACARASASGPHGGGRSQAEADAGADLGRVFAVHPDAKAQTKAAYKEQTTTDIDSMLAIFYVLLALAVIVSLFGIVNTLVLSTFERTRELGMLRAVGMSRRQVRRMVRHESIITALIGAGLGIAAGLALAAAVTAAFADEGLSFAVPAGSLITLVIVATVAGVLAAILPARRASRLDPLTALAYE